MIITAFRETKRSRSLRQQLYKLIDKYGMGDQRVLKKNNELDAEIVKNQKTLFNLN